MLVRRSDHQDPSRLRDLGCPVRFVLTADQAGDAVQAGALLTGMSADVVADHFRLAIACKGAFAIIPNKPSRSSEHPLDEHLYPFR